MEQIKLLRPLQIGENTFLPPGVYPGMVKERQGDPGISQKPDYPEGYPVTAYLHVGSYYHKVHNTHFPVFEVMDDTYHAMKWWANVGGVEEREALSSKHGIDGKSMEPVIRAWKSETQKK